MHTATIQNNLWIRLVLVLGLLIFSQLTSAILAQAEEYLPPFYPSKFDGVGVVDAVNERELVIDDMAIFYLSTIRCYDETGARLALSDIKPGRRVGYLTNDEGAIREVWRFKTNPSTD